MLPITSSTLCLQNAQPSHLLGNFDLDMNVVVSITVAVYPGNPLSTHPNLLVSLDARGDLGKDRED